MVFLVDERILDLSFPFPEGMPPARGQGFFMPGIFHDN